jgi:hypothetical protein
VCFSSALGFVPELQLWSSWFRDLLQSCVCVAWLDIGVKGATGIVSWPDQWSRSPASNINEQHAFTTACARWAWVVTLCVYVFICIHLAEQHMRHSDGSGIVWQVGNWQACCCSCRMRSAVDGEQHPWFKFIRTRFCNCSLQHCKVVDRCVDCAITCKADCVIWPGNLAALHGSCGIGVA